ncbi:CLUMA_CG014648, isoform A [Clunio marinus]|uniref:CLUMA_CG014648, isoform A n=1 Tax=Clunio marinus TaxID=568069 RepID=A0A1J1INQ1_9DIPT|nr:CLUMA_CG014648, isoform A [Clunio marinus]
MEKNTRMPQDNGKLEIYCSFHVEVGMQLYLRHRPWWESRKAPPTVKLLRDKAFPFYACCVVKL